MLQMRKLRHRQVKSLVQAHAASKQMSWDLNLCSQALKLAQYFFFPTRHSSDIWPLGGEGHPRNLVGPGADGCWQPCTGTWCGGARGCPRGKGFPESILMTYSGIFLHLLLLPPLPAMQGMGVPSPLPLHNVHLFYLQL